MVSENPSPEKPAPPDGAKNWIAEVIYDIAVTAKQYPRLLVLIVVAILMVSLLLLLYFVTISSVYKVDGAGVFGDTFGFVTAFFTGVGFIGIAATIFAELQARETETAVASMNMVYAMDDRFSTDAMRTSRRIASGWLLSAYENDGQTGPVSNEVDVHIRAVLNSLERIAHFTKHKHVDEDLILSAFHIRMMTYLCFAERYFITDARQRSGDTILWRDLQEFCRKTIPKWNESQQREHGLTISETAYKMDNLKERLEREYVRCGGPARKRK
jgi:hypothetical protein